MTELNLDLWITALVFIVIMYLLVRAIFNQKKYVFLDIETTGFGDNENKPDEILEIAIIDYKGNVLLNTLIKPSLKKSWRAAQKIHNISPSMVKRAPQFDEVKAKVDEILLNKKVVVYNLSFEKKFLFESLSKAASLHCCMLKFAKHKNEKTKYGGYRWFKLEDAAQMLGHNVISNNHRALIDARLCKFVWDRISIL